MCTEKNLKELFKTRTHLTVKVLSKQRRTMHKVWQWYISDPRIMVTNVTLNGRISDLEFKLSPKNHWS